MSLLSIKNFISPFTNTVHAVTIILVTVLFALFRLQGGGMSANFSKRSDTRYESKKEVYVPREPLQNDSGLDNLIKREPVARPQENRLPDSGSIQISGGEEDLLKQMIGKKPLDEGAPKPVKVAPKKGASDFDDIEKSLGMR